MMAGMARFIVNMLITKDGLCSFISAQANVQDRPKGSGPYMPQPIKGNIAHKNAYSHVPANSICTVLLLIFFAKHTNTHTLMNEGSKVQIHLHSKSLLCVITLFIYFFNPYEFCLSVYACLCVCMCIWPSSSSDLKPNETWKTVLDPHMYYTILSKATAAFYLKSLQCFIMLFFNLWVRHFLLLIYHTSVFIFFPF